jgi:hypothetical protein
MKFEIYRYKGGCFMTFAEKLKDPEFQKLVKALADGESIEVEGKGFKPDIDPMMAERLKRFSSWYEAELSSDGDNKPVFITNFESLPFTNEELGSMDELVDQLSNGSVVGV